MQEKNVVSPGQILSEMMKAKGWTQVDLAAILEKPQNSISQIITGKKAVTPETAISLAQAFGNSPEYWIQLEGESSSRLSLNSSTRLATVSNTIWAIVRMAG